MKQWKRYFAYRRRNASNIGHTQRRCPRCESGHFDPKYTGIGDRCATCGKTFLGGSEKDLGRPVPLPKTRK